MRFFAFSLAIYFLLICACAPDNSITLTGEVIDRPIDSLLLIRAHENLRYQGVKIPVKENNTFSYSFSPEHIEEYSLVFKSEHQNGMWKPINFFPDAPTIAFELHKATEFEKNEITGSPLTQKKASFEKRLKDLHSEAFNSLYENINQLEPNSSERRLVEQKLNSLVLKVLHESMAHYKKNPSILGYSEYVKALQQIQKETLSHNGIKEYHEFWLEQYPNHPLSERAINAYSTLTSLNTDGYFIDFETLDNSNEAPLLSRHIKNNKYTLLDLWSPWCGPCIKKSQLIKSNYKELTDIGFSVFSVVGGIKEMSSYQKAVNRLDYPWRCYIEINNQNRIWEKYGISNAGGAQFLFDNNGKLLATNPSIDQIRDLIAP